MALAWVFSQSSPLMEENDSSIGSMISRSTVSGDAPGYGMTTPTMGC